MEKDNRIKNLFQDIGKCTLRGVRKCPKCGTLNGMRGVCCKNRSCDVVFKEAGEKRKFSTDVCKITTGSSTQIFSVRVRDKGPDYRGFVQLPLGNESMFNDSACLCFVDSCQKTFTTTILKCHEKELQLSTACQHIQTALRCYTEAQHLIITHSVLYSLNIPEHLKKELLDFAVDTIGPLVQRVSKSVMVVKCKVTSKNPLGYLHITFNAGGNQAHYTCTCPLPSKGVSKLQKNSNKLLLCMHYYACLAAFASDKKLSEEFGTFINPVRSIMCFPPPEEVDSNQQQFVALMNDVAGCEMKVNMMPEEAAILDQYSIGRSADFSSIGVPQIATEVSAIDTDVNTISIEVNGMATEGSCMASNGITIEVNGMATEGSGMATDVSAISIEPDIVALLINKPLLGQNVAKATITKPTLPITEVTKKGQMKLKRAAKCTAGRDGLQENTAKKPRKVVNSPKTTVKSDRIDENSTYQSFVNWLGSVTERINQNMHYELSGKPSSLVFYIPESFYECLRERISAVGNKRRLPNKSSLVVRKHVVSSRTFTKYTWHINNIFHCKQIFETAQVPLEITRSFIQKRDGTYEPYIRSTVQDEVFSKLENSPRIKPLELQTYLKVGRTSFDQALPTPLIIEWTPDVLPKSKVGELIITFEFGHMKPTLNNM